jgi:hypothetical protein
VLGFLLIARKVREGGMLRRVLPTHDQQQDNSALSRAF